MKNKRASIHEKTFHSSPQEWNVHHDKKTPENKQTSNSLLQNSNLFFYSILFLIAVVIISLRIGFTSILPHYFGWLSYNNDLSMGLLDWLFYLNEPWRFPIIGSIDSIYAPIGTSLALCDVLPLVSVFFKFIGRLFGFYNFQYFGLWGVICCFLTGYFTIKILQLYNIKYRLHQLLIAILVMSTPPFLHRMGFHINLITHFIILASFYFYLKNNTLTRHKDITLNYIKWGLLIALVIGINVYLWVIVAAIYVFSLLHLAFRKIFKPLIFSIGILGISIGLSFMFLYIYGMFILPQSKAPEMGGFGVYSANLNTFWNPLEYAHFIEAKPAEHGQYEGYAYLGFGMLLALTWLCIQLCISFFKKNDFYKSFKKEFLSTQFILLLIIAILFALYSLSNKIYFNSTLIAEIPIPEKISKIVKLFRTSGRYIWVLYYVIFVFGLIGLYKLYDKKNTTIITAMLSFIVMIQFIDMNKMFIDAGSNTLEADFFMDELDVPFWEKKYQENEVTPVPALECLYYAKPLDWSKFQYLSFQHHKKSNTGMVARQDNQRKQKYIEKENQRIRTCQLRQKNEIFIISKNFYFRGEKYDNPYINVFADVQHKFKIQEKDGYYILEPKQEFITSINYVDKNF